MTYPENFPIELSVTEPREWHSQLGMEPLRATLLKWEIDRDGKPTQALMMLLEPKVFHGVECVYFLVRSRIFGDGLAGLTPGGSVFCDAIRIPYEQATAVNVFDWTSWWKDEIRLVCTLRSRTFTSPIDETFPHTYTIRELQEMPDDLSMRRYQYPGGIIIDGYNYHGDKLEIQPENDYPWIGVFDLGGWGKSGIYTTPNPSTFCVVIDGAGCFVNADDPADWEEVDAFPIWDVRTVPSHNLLLFTDYTDLIAYGEQGMKWQTDHLVSDELKITDITTTVIKGACFDPIHDTGTFIVDLETGTRLDVVDMAASRKRTPSFIRRLFGRFSR